MDGPHGYRDDPGQFSNPGKFSTPGQFFNPGILGSFFTIPLPCFVYGYLPDWKIAPDWNIALDSKPRRPIPKHQALFFSKKKGGGVMHRERDKQRVMLRTLHVELFYCGMGCGRPSAPLGCTQCKTKNKKKTQCHRPNCFLLVMLTGDQDNAIG